MTIIDMRDFTLTSSHETLLGQLVGRHVRQIVWDLNALYVIRDRSALKVEVFADWPGSDVTADNHEEIVFIRPWQITPAPVFRATGEEGYWYTVVAEEADILGVEIVRMTVVFPSGRSVNCSVGTKSVIADVGVILTLREGVVPAVLLGNSFGFATWPEIRIYRREEVMQILGNACHLRALDAKL